MQCERGDRAAAGARRPEPDAAGAHQPRGERHPGDAGRRRGCASRGRQPTHAAARRTGRPTRATTSACSVEDEGTGIAPERSGAHLRAVLHHQGGRRGDRARPLGRVRHRPRARRLDRGRERGSAGAAASRSSCRRAAAPGRRWRSHERPRPRRRRRAAACARCSRRAWPPRGFDDRAGRRPATRRSTLLDANEVDVVVTDLNMRGDERPRAVRAHRRRTGPTCRSS